MRIKADSHITNWETAFDRTGTRMYPFLMPGESVVVTQPLEGNNQPLPLSVRTGMDCHGHQSSELGKPGVQKNSHMFRSTKIKLIDKVSTFQLGEILLMWLK